VARKLREVAEGALVVLDEPYLCAFGSAFVNVPRNDVVAAIDAGVAAIHKEGALAGLHCCGNTDWSLVFSTDLDVVNFDAYEYFQGLSLYPAELSSFSTEGRRAELGHRTGSRQRRPQRAYFAGRAGPARGTACRQGMDRGALYRQALLTPSCGLATESVEAADRLMDTLAEVSSLVRERDPGR